MPYNASAKQTAKSYVATVRATTVCKVCGRQPIDWHRKEHEANSNLRVPGLAARGHSIARIAEEIAASEPLCRSCHMKLDGRLAQLLKNRPRQKGMALPPKPCVDCGQLAKPLRKGLCNKCNQRHRRCADRDEGGYGY